MPTPEAKMVVCPECATAVNLNADDGECPKCGLSVRAIYERLRHEKAFAKVKAEDETKNNPEPKKKSGFSW